MMLAADSLAAVSLAAGPAELGRAATLRAGARLTVAPSRVLPVSTVDVERLQTASIIVNHPEWGMDVATQWGIA